MIQNFTVSIVIWAVSKLVYYSVYQKWYQVEKIKLLISAIGNNIKSMTAMDVNSSTGTVQVGGWVEENGHWAHLGK